MHGIQFNDSMIPNDFNVFFLLTKIAYTAPDRRTFIVFNGFIGSSLH